MKEGNTRDDCGPILPLDLPPDAIALIDAKYKCSPGQKNDHIFEEFKQAVAARIVELGEWKTMAHYCIEQYDTDGYRRAHRAVMKAIGTAKDREWRHHRLKNRLANGVDADTSQPKRKVPTIKPLGREESARLADPETPTSDLKIDCQNILEGCSERDNKVAEMLKEKCTDAFVCKKLGIHPYQLEQSRERLRIKFKAYVEHRARTAPT